MVDQSYPETAQLPLSPEMVLTAAREVVTHLHSLNKPYSAGVVDDCIATIENLVSRLPGVAQRAVDRGEPVAWFAEYDGHLDTTIYRDTMERWKALGRKITPLYAVTPSPGPREETDEQLDERLAKQEARENLRLLDHIAHKIGLPIDQELSRENFNSWLSSVPSTDRGAGK